MTKVTNPEAAVLSTALLPAGLTLRNATGKGRPGRTHGWSRPIRGKLTSLVRLGPD
jgi:hypothetical protein